MKRILGSFVFGLLLATVNGARADDVLLEQLYGQGVHAYNSGDFAGAHASLTQAIKGGSNDPRSYYFRGLAYLRLGREEEARVDFQKGAELESGESADVYPVSRSLERIQGAPRQLLEQYRIGVQAIAAQKRDAARRVRYQQRVEAERDILRQVKPNELPARPGASPVTPATNENPFAPSATPAGGAPPAQNENPFIQGGAPAQGGNPFEGAAKAAPVTPEVPPEQPGQNVTPPSQVAPPGNATPITPEADPFGGGAGLATPPSATLPTTPPMTPTPEPNPTGDAKLPATPPVTNPTPPSTNPTPGADANDPFGAPTGNATPPTTNPTPPATNPTPPDMNDPFGGGAPANATPPTTTPPSTDTNPPAAGGNSAATVAPTPGGLGGLYRAFTGGGSITPPGPTPPAPPPSGPSLLDMIQGFMGGPGPAGPPTGMGVGPRLGANTAPSGDDPFADTPPMGAPQNPANNGPPTPANMMPKPPQAAPPATQPPTPAPTDDPFK